MLFNKNNKKKNKKNKKFKKKITKKRVSYLKIVKAEIYVQAKENSIFHQNILYLYYTVIIIF